MSFNFNLPLGPWFVIVVIIVALFMALICTAIMYICCRGCYTAETLPATTPANGVSPQTLNAIAQDKPPSYRRFLRNLSNINLRVLGSSNANASRSADTGTPPPKYGDVVSKFQFSSKEIKEFESMQNNFTANYKFRPSISEALRRPPDLVRHQIIIPQLCVTPPPTEFHEPGGRENSNVGSDVAGSPGETRIRISDPPPEYTPPSIETIANHAPEGGYDNPTCVISDVT